MAPAAAPPTRLVRPRDPFAHSALDRLDIRLRGLGYAMPLYERRLGGPHPGKLTVQPVDPVPGDAAAGKGLLAGTLAGGGGTSSIEQGQPWLGLSARRDSHRRYAHGFTWLRDLAAAPDRTAAAQLAQRLTGEWMDRFGRPNNEAWAPETLARRLTAWLLAAPLLLSGSDLVFRSWVLTVLARQARHLVRTRNDGPDCMAALECHAALVLAEQVLPLGKRGAQRSQRALARVVDRFVLTDGGPLSRRPGDALATLRLLLILRGVYETLLQEPPAWLVGAMDRLGPFVRALRGGDGQIVRLHGGGHQPLETIDALLAATGQRTRPIADARFTGLQRMAARRTLVVMDCGPPPPPSLSAHASAGTLSLLLYDGQRPLVTNMGCGRTRMIPDQLVALSRTSAAHSTAVLADTNSTEVAGDRLGAGGVSAVDLLRREDETGILVEARHDGYRRRYKLDHHRRLFLSADGRQLTGSDRFEPVGRGRIKQTRLTLRFHLHPDVAAQAAHDGRSCLLSLANEQGWRFRLGSGGVSVEESLFLCPDLGPRRCKQLVVQSCVGPQASELVWAFERVARRG